MNHLEWEAAFGDVSVFAGLRIAYVITRSDSIGGAHVHVSHLAQFFASLGSDVRVYVGGEGPFTERLTLESVDYRSLRFLVRPMRPLIDFAGVIELRSSLEKFSPHLISSHSAKAGAVSRIAGKALGVPVLYTAHGWPFTEGIRPSRRGLYWLVEKLLEPLGSKVITVSEFDRALALRAGVGDESRIVTVRNGMPDLGEEFRAAPDREPPRIVMVARFDEQKDHETLFVALERLRDFDWEVQLVGDGPEEITAKRMAADLGLEQRIQFLGSRDDVPALLSKASVFALISNWEGLPRSIIEAMRAGLPVVASDVGGVGELVENGVTGLTVPRGEAKMVAQAIRRLLISPELRCSMGEAARRRFLSHFEWKCMISRTIAVYQDILA